MNYPVLATIVWVLMVSFVGMLPRRFHKRFGFPLLLAFPIVVILLWRELGWIWGMALILAGLSIYRYPARYYGLALLRRLGIKG